MGVNYGRWLLSIIAPMLIFSMVAFAQNQENPSGSSALEEQYETVSNKELIVNKFNRISIQGSFNVEVKIGREHKCLIVGSDTQIPYVEAKMQGDTLVIQPKPWHPPKFFGVPQIKIFIETPMLRGLKISGAGDLTFAGTNPGPLDVDSAGSGKVTLTGKADLFTGKLSGSGDFIAGEFSTCAANIEVNGSGNVELGKVTDRLSVLVKGSGDVKINHFSGKSATLKVESSGKIHAAGTSDQCRTQIDGSGDIMARNLLCNNVNARIFGSGNIKIHPEQYLKAVISGSGDIVYFGDPEAIERTIEGSGQIRSGY